MPDRLLGTQSSTWHMLETVLGASSASLGFTWLLYLPMWGLMWAYKG
jgi:hypothetical protein